MSLNMNTGIEVNLNNCKNFEDMFKKFKKKVSKSGVLKEYKERMSYVKPGDRKRRKRAMAIKTMQKEQEELMGGVNQ